MPLLRAGFENCYFNEAAERSYHRLPSLSAYCCDINHSCLHASIVVTGLKIATGSSVKIASVKKKGAVAEIGADLTSIGVPFEIGPKFNLERETRDEIGFDESTDFIAGIRVRKLAYKKHWLLRTRGTLTAMEFTKGATMVDDDYMGEAPGEEILDLGEADGLIAEHEIEIVDGEAVGIGWVL